MVQPFFRMMRWTRKAIIPWLEQQILDIDANDERRCTQHQLRGDQDSCPCDNRSIWLRDRYDESLYRLRRPSNPQSTLSWYLWFLRSSPDNKLFPRQSIDCYDSVQQPVAAWEKYQVAKRNWQKPQNDPMGYVYYRKGHVSRGRPAAGPRK